MSSELILIADGNLGRAHRLASELEAGGRRCEIAAHGAAALELALTHQPRIVVARSDLTLVEAGKLAEILRANPRTRAARFLFLDVEVGRLGDYGGVGDQALEPHAESDEIHAAIDALIERQVRIEALEQRANLEREFEGTLAELQPALILQLLNGRRASGRLTITPELADGTTTDGWVQVNEGEIHSAGTGPAIGEKALYRMLEWQAGDFHFEPREASGPAQVKAPTRTLLAEGLRQLDEWNRFAPKFPPFESPVKLRVDRAELPNIVHPLTQEVLGLLESVDRVGDVVDQCSRPDYQVLRTLHTLSERGIIEFGRARLAPVEVSRHALFHEAQCRRLRAFAGQGLARESTPPDNKLLVVAADQAIAARFASLLTKVPGAELAPRFERGLVGASDLESIGRIDVDGEFGIDLVHLPREAAFDPLWRFAGHRALGTVFLLDARVGVSAAGLAPINEVLSQAPGARTFHVVMLDEGERLSPDDLRENLALIDEASLFLLPIETNGDPSAVLRSLFARIVP